MRTAGIALFFLVGGTAGHAGDELEIPARYVAAVDRANEQGDRIYLHDMAASRATDELAARKLLDSETRVRGWLTDEYAAGEEPGIIVTFVGLDGDKPMGLYRVRVPPGSRPPAYEAITPAVPLDEGQSARWRARAAAQAALEARKDLCGEAYNTVVLPSRTGGDIEVYMLAATSQPDVMIAGGHFRYEFTADGTRLVSQRAFTRACVDIPIGADPKKGRLAALTLTHLLDPTPTEVHTWLSRNYRQTLYVGTTENSLMWIIMEGHVVASKSFADEGKKPH